ncbi:metallophosphatase family protein [Halorussus gelatinilyticus]|uniref:Metallophosphatase family protein n=1 Tax=Halorussus gelatinilyticus TaxID=2937524 RepID=A0A8U0IIG8_9EURY|nr:metallophosphoesterase family protein [Halorussus gelatinilyticus]UPW00823.1 metallophosphatase family protein [Halorussus gelatinilyticus]
MPRTLVVSDVHANAVALDAVLAAEPDRDAVVFLGDAVDNGPHPNAVCDRLRGLNFVAGVRGNHDRTVLAAPPDESGASESNPPADSFAEWQAWTHASLSPENRDFLESLDRTKTLTLGGRTARLHHGDFPAPEGREETWRTRVTPEEDPAPFEAVAARYDEDVVFHGHSHFPFVATVAGTTFVNPGSVGLQRPGWPADEARYAVFEDGAFDLRRVAYDPAPVATDSRELDSPFVDLWEPASATVSD